MIHIPHIGWIMITCIDQWSPGQEFFNGKINIKLRSEELKSGKWILINEGACRWSPPALLHPPSPDRRWHVKSQTKSCLVRSSLPTGNRTLTLKTKSNLMLSGISIESNSTHASAITSKQKRLIYLRVYVGTLGKLKLKKC